MVEDDKGTIAYLMMNVETGKEYDVINRIRQMEENVVESYIVYGAWDIIVKIQTESMAALNSLVLKIRRSENVNRSMTLIALTGDLESFKLDLDQEPI
ncbi:MAG: Lrp/AsnC family transcriptional regulator [Promethearchaeota archaeon]|nr:MAG: Lrp/AsnC family transcriptional regulator [Candidatus Lokiarchaeota archaeon]